MLEMLLRNAVCPTLHSSAVLAGTMIGAWPRFVMTRQVPCL
ncbi:hypothetical protein SAMN05443573_13123 [Celeribacter indicus]|nr:hypothetical protein SAMN05443573_13123 [Celeribacter indicus]